eukprot:12929938-Ditylum_brightwellii.AAC.1
MVPEAFIAYNKFTRPPHGEDDTMDIISDLDYIVANDERHTTQDEDVDEDNEVIPSISGALDTASTAVAQTNTTATPLCIP